MKLFKTFGAAWLLRRYPMVAMATLAYNRFKRRGKSLSHSKHHR